MSTPKSPTGPERRMPMIDISGDPRERGRQYGEAARPLIQRGIAFYQEAFARSARLAWPEILARAQEWTPLIEQYLPGITDEMRGIGEGAGCAFEEILALNGRGELSHGNPFDDSKDGCTSYAMLSEASGDGHVYCGQNWDWRKEVAETLIMLRVRQPRKPTIIMQAEAGQVGRQGANSAGIGLNANGLGVRFGTQLGVPSPYIRRRILESSTMYDALEAIFSVRQAFSNNILLTHRDGFAIDLETTPGRHGWLYPENGLLVHGNHFMAFVPEQVADSYRPFSVDSLYRTSRARQALSHCVQATDSATVREMIARAMSDHFSAPNSICNHPDERQHPLDQTQTIASSIVDLTTGDYYVSAGQPCVQPYVKLPFNLYERT